jgi:hypothetical protein
VSDFVQRAVEDRMGSRSAKAIAKNVATELLPEPERMLVERGTLASVPTKPHRSLERHPPTGSFEIRVTAEEHRHHPDESPDRLAHTHSSGMSAEPSARRLSLHKA